VLIELPRGGYAVVCKYRDPKATGAAVPPPISTLAPIENDKARNRRLWRRVRTVVVAGLVVVGAAAIVLQQREAARVEEAEQAPVVRGVAGRPPLVVADFEVLGGSEGVGELASTLREEIFLVLDGPEALVAPAVASRTASAATLGYVLNGTVREVDGTARITVRVARADTGTLVFSSAYDEPLDALRSAEGQRRIARLVALAAEPYGPIFEAEVERMRAVPLHAPTTRECMLLYYEYRRAFAAAAQASAVECFEQAAKEELSSAEAWAGISLLYSDAWAHGFAGQAGSAAALERARETARRAMDIDGEDMHANLALAAVQYFSGAEVPDAVERILARWPDHPEAQAMVGAMLVLSGDASRGKRLVESAVEWSPQVPSGYHASLALAALRERRHDDALESALRIDAPDWPLGQVIVAAACALGGRADLAARARARAIELDPTLAASLSDVMRRWRVEPVLAHEIERGFAASAGR
jgi:TolB-like protein